MAYEKLVKDGMVAVLYSPGFGAGWYSWNTEHEGLIFDKELVNLVVAGKTGAAVTLAKRKYPEIYDGGGGNLKVHWVPQGSRFEINEYDGSESVRVFGPNDGIVA